jgi:hypothetical protein
MSNNKPAAYAKTEIALQRKSTINIASTPDGDNYPPVLVFQNNPGEVSVQFTAKDNHASGNCYATFSLYQGRGFVKALAEKLGLKLAEIDNVEHTKALEFAREVEKQIMEVVNGERKPGKLAVEPIGRLIEYIRNGKTHDVSLKP